MTFGSIITFIVGLLKLLWPRPTPVDEKIKWKEYKEYEEWEKQKYEMLKQIRRVIKDTNFASQMVTAFAEDHNDDAMRKWSAIRTKLHAERDKLRHELLEHERREPARI